MALHIYFFFLFLGYMELLFIGLSGFFIWYFLLSCCFPINYLYFFFSASVCFPTQSILFVHCLMYTFSFTLVCVYIFVHAFILSQLPFHTPSLSFNILISYFMKYMLPLVPRCIVSHNDDDDDDDSKQWILSLWRALCVLIHLIFIPRGAIMLSIS